MRTGATRAIGVFLLGTLPSVAPASADLITAGDAAAVGLRPYWKLAVSLGGQVVERVALVDDNLYVITNENVVHAIHAGTGVLRWSIPVAAAGHRILGPTHSGPLAFFTTQAGVHVLHRQTGRPAEQQRDVAGVIIDVIHDTATVNLGSAHGLSLGDRLTVTRRGDRTRSTKIADLVVTVIRERQAEGRIQRVNPVLQPESGDVVSGRLTLQQTLIDLPFAPSSPAIGSGDAVYYGASNARVYRVNFSDGIVRWQFGLPGVVSGEPRLLKDALYVASQGGTVAACQAATKAPVWTFEAEGPVFQPLWVDESGVYVATSDRFVYALNVKDGTERWRMQISTAELGAPIVASETVFVSARDTALYALDTQSETRVGSVRWKVEGDCRLLAVDGADAYVERSGAKPRRGPAPREVLQVDLKTGRVKSAMRADGADWIVGVSSPLTLLAIDRSGRVQCLRGASYPFITPDQLAAVLRADQAARTGRPAAAAKASAVRTAASAPASDPFRSDSRQRPVGGHGLVGADDGEGATEAGADKPPAGEAGDEPPADEAAEVDAQEPASTQAGGEAQAGDADSGGDEARDGDSADEDSDGDANTNGDGG